MRMTLALTALALMLDSMPASAATAPGPEDRRALEALARQADEAWNVRDAATMSTYYTADGNLKLSGMATPLENRAAIKTYFDRAFAQRPGEMRHVTTMTNAEMVAPDVVFTDSDVRVERKNADGSYTLLRTFANHAVVIRDGGAWRLRSVRAHGLPDPQK